MRQWCAAGQPSPPLPIAGAAGSRALDEAGVSTEEADATCPICQQLITSVVGGRHGTVQLRAVHFACGGWKRGSRGKAKGDPEYRKADLPGTWTLYASETEPGKFYTMGPHLERLKMSADEPLVFTTRPRPSLD